MASSLSMLWIAFLLGCLNLGHHANASITESGQVKGYYPSYNYRGQSVSQINYSLYTDLIFFVVIPKPGNHFDFDPQLTRDQGIKMAKEFVSHCKKNKVTPHLSYGGWTGSVNFSNLTSTPSARQSFAKAMVDFAKSLGFLGIELDWEYPTSQGIGCNSNSPQDTVNFGLLTKEIRALWPDVRMSAAISISGLLGANGGTADAKETSLLAANLNYVNLMTYDVYGSWSDTTGPIAPLRGTCDPAVPGGGPSVETAHHVALKQGFKPHQIVLGIPTYAKRLQLVSPKLQATVTNGKTSYYYQKHTKVTPPGGEFDDRPMTNICGVHEGAGGSFLTRELISNKWLSEDQNTGGMGYTRYFDNCSGQPFLTNGKYLISYDDTASTVSKAKYASANYMAGIFLFDTQGPLDITVKSARDAFGSRNPASSG